MKHSEKVETILFIRPDAAFCLRGDDLEWLDKSESKPTNEEIEAGWIAYQAKLEADKLEAAAKKAAAEAKLAALGLDADDFRALGI